MPCCFVTELARHYCRSSLASVALLQGHGSSVLGLSAELTARSRLVGSATSLSDPKGGGELAAGTRPGRTERLLRRADVESSA